MFPLAASCAPPAAPQEIHAGAQRSQEGAQVPPPTLPDHHPGGQEGHPQKVEGHALMPGGMAAHEGDPVPGLEPGVPPGIGAPWKEWLPA